jgi:lipopolysaccharide/colanic/teichoic acid biosynthesis glycosyltransferase
MHAFGTITLLAGLAIILLSQVYVTAMTFKLSPVKGILCLVIPGYALFCAKRHGFYGKFFAAYFIGILGLVVGGAILS